MEDLKEQFENEMEKVQQDNVLSPEYRRKKLIMYVIRTVIAIVLFYVFWEHQWAKWMLYVYIPLNLIFLVSIFVMPYFLKRKIKSTQQIIDELDQFEEE
ncbi:hypothetical protein [Psychroserpens sp.]|uniref:hypothetical protein n=1 Tax=Psychroserpens sp. TaxID=2020870 RepID=UPI00385A43D5